MAFLCTSTPTPCPTGTTLSSWNKPTTSNFLLPNSTLLTPSHPTTTRTALLKCSSATPSLSLYRQETMNYFNQPKHEPDDDDDEEEEEEEGGEEDDDEELVGKEDDRPLHQIWRQIQGSDDWQGLLDPLNSHLRREIIRYGEFAQACYDSFDYDPHSKYCGSCKYPGSHFFHRLEMQDRGYTLSRYLYATSNINLPNFFQHSSMSSVWSPHANWMGYVAVATDEAEVARLGRRDILIAWRGTVTYLEWIYDLKDILCPAHFRGDPSIKIEAGFYDLYTKKEKSCHYCTYSAREQVLAEIRRLVERYKGEQLSITVTGHSLGAALAVLNAYDLAEMKVNVAKNGGDGREGETIPIAVYSFSGPRVGNLKFKERCDELGVKVLRVVNVHDVVPTVPGIIANERFQFQRYVEDVMSFPWSYAHVGAELKLDHKISPFLQPTKDPGRIHNLEMLLHLVDCHHGHDPRRPFVSATGRDVALVNKSCDFLKPEYGVPPCWRQDENKGMVRNSDGRWHVPERPRVEAHPPDTDHHLEQVLNNNTNSVDAGDGGDYTNNQFPVEAAVLLGVNNTNNVADQSSQMQARPTG